MSVLIKGMVMPENCDECRLNNGIFCYAVPDYAVDDVMGRTDDRPPWCPLVELPPHGRLIDADALHIDLMDRGIADIQTSDWYEIQQAVDDAPTIIEAETCNEICNKLQDCKQESEEEDGIH